MLHGMFMLAWFSLTTATLSDDGQYCAQRYKRLCMGKGNHVACQFPYPGAGPGCENYTQIKFTKEMQHFILHYINRRRQRIAMGNERVRGGLYIPKPQIMTFVEWDRELSFLAQRLADQCHFVHDDCRATVRFPYAGQTVGEVRWRKSSDSEVVSAQSAMRRVFDAWWGEKRRVEPKHLTSPFKLTPKGAVWGHFTQLAIWNLRAVGCGAVRHGETQPRLLLVCDFSHTNMLGQRTLVPGPLAACPVNTVRRSRSVYPLLCAPVRSLQPNEKEHYTEEQYDSNTADEYIEGADVHSTGPNLWLSRSFERTKINDDVGKEDELIRIKAYQKAQTNLAMTENSQRKIEMRNKDDQIEILNDKDFKLWSNKKTNFDESRSQENADEIKGPYFTAKYDDTKFFYLPISRVIDSEQNVRQRWKQTRVRPQRPGANALIAGATEIVVKPLRRQPSISLMLDKEDVDQLFKDTGFRFPWRPNGIQSVV